MPRPRRTVLVLLLAACGLFDATSGDTDATTTDGGATDTPTGGPVACVVEADCPPPGACEQVACDDGLCGYTARPAGERVDDAPGDCVALVCDGAGLGSPEPEPDDVPDDANDCTDDVCVDGEPANPGLPAGAACGDGFVCHADQTCRPCPAVDGCEDTSAYEPNESQSTASELPVVRDDDDAAYLCEALGSAGDVDWFTYETVDTALGGVVPAISSTAPEALVCMYFQCKAGGTTVVCPGGTAELAAPLGQQGCCGHGDFEPYVDCKGFDEDATVWLEIRHDAEEPPDCLHYQVGYVY